MVETTITAKFNIVIIKPVVDKIALSATNFHAKGEHPLLGDAQVKPDETTLLVTLEPTGFVPSEVCEVQSLFVYLVVIRQ